MLTYYFDPLVIRRDKSGYEMPNRICIELANSIGLTIDPKGNFNPISLDRNSLLRNMTRSNTAISSNWASKIDYV